MLALMQIKKWWENLTDKKNELNVVNWGNLARPAHSESSWSPSILGDKDTSFLQV